MVPYAIQAMPLALGNSNALLLAARVRPPAVPAHGLVPVAARGPADPGG